MTLDAFVSTVTTDFVVPATPMEKFASRTTPI
jgi:hypothetical protein